MDNAKATAELQELWETLQDDAGPARQHYAAGYADALANVGLITSAERDGWVMRFINQCPDNGDHAGRGWCAYCGNVSGEGAEGGESER